jgi:hypothetical protein
VPDAVLTQTSEPPVLTITSLNRAIKSRRSDSFRGLGEDLGWGLNRWQVPVAIARTSEINRSKSPRRRGEGKGVVAGPRLRMDSRGAGGQVNKKETPHGGEFLVFLRSDGCTDQAALGTAAAWFRISRALRSCRSSLPPKFSGSCG